MSNKVPAPSADEPPKGPPLVVQLGLLAVMTAAALGIGWVSGNYLRGSEPPVESAAKTDPAKPSPAAVPETGHDAPQEENAVAEVAQDDSRMVIPLAPITTNLAAPSEVWIRLEASIVLDQPPADPGLADQVHQDMLAYVRTLKLHEVEGPSGFRHLRNDLDERAAVRSNGLVSQVLIRTLLFE